MKIGKKAVSVLVATLTVTSLGVTGTAWADTSVGSNGGGVSNNDTYNSWNEGLFAGTSGGTNGESAWTRFNKAVDDTVAVNGVLKSTILGQKNKLPTGNLGGASSFSVEGCKKSHSIWWPTFKRGQNNGGYVAGHWYQLYTSTFPTSFRNFSLTTTVGKSPLSDLGTYNKIISHNAVKGSGYWKTGVAIVCSWNVGIPTEVEVPVKEVTEKEVDHRTSPDYFTATAPSEYYTEVLPHPIQGMEMNGIHYQRSGIVKTEFGKALDEIGRLKEYRDDHEGKTVAEVRAKINAALALDRSRSYTASVDLDNTNKKGVAKGGVIDFSNKAQYRTITAGTTRHDSYDKVCKQKYKYNPNTKAYDIKVGGKYGCTDWHNHQTWYSDVSMSKSLPTTREVGFRQLLGVVCNNEEFDALSRVILARGGSTDSGALTGGGSQSRAIWSKFYTSRPSNQNLDFAPTIPSGVSTELVKTYDLSNTTDPEEVKGRMAIYKTSLLGFYDKECTADCEPPSSPTPTPGGGEDVKTVNSHEIFRDNSGVEIELPVVRPISNRRGLVFDSTSKAATTTFVNWTEGTPGTVVKESSGGRVEIKAKDYNGNVRELFTGSATAVPSSQINGRYPTYSTQNATQLAGEFNKIIAGSTWASDADRPQVLNVKWEYVGKTISNRPSKLEAAFTNGTSASISTRHGGHSSEWVNADVKCDLNYGKDVSTNPSSNVHLVTMNTGTGVPNNLDKEIAQPGNTFDELVADGNNLVLNYIRAVGS